MSHDRKHAHVTLLFRMQSMFLYLSWAWAHAHGASTPGWRLCHHLWAQKERKWASASEGRKFWVIAQHLIQKDFVWPINEYVGYKSYKPDHKLITCTHLNLSLTLNIAHGCINICPNSWTDWAEEDCDHVIPSSSIKPNPVLTLLLHFFNQLFISPKGFTADNMPVQHCGYRRRKWLCN